MSTPSIQSVYLAGAELILSGRGASLEATLARLRSLNPELDIPDSPTLNDLASLLELNEKRRAGKKKILA